jgi:PleD family two-component response regulator
VLITFSAGVAQRSTGESQDDLVERADRALYRAKEAGKNRVFAA